MKLIRLGTKNQYHYFKPETMLRVRRIMDLIHAIEVDEELPFIEINSGCAFFHLEVVKDATRCVAKCRDEIDELIAKSRGEAG